MRTAFNIVGRVISTLLGLLLVLMGGVWILQAYNIAFNGPMGPGGARSFMVENHPTPTTTAIAVVVGVVQVIWSNTRKS